jgi:hypothetical protein
VGSALPRGLEASFTLCFYRIAEIEVKSIHPSIPQNFDEYLKHHCLCNCLLILHTRAYAHQIILHSFYFMFVSVPELPG